MSEIARYIKKPPATVYSYLLYHGGFEPIKKVRRLKCLTFEERESISRALARGCSIRSIARELNRAPSTISREIARNGGIAKYRATIAEQAYSKRAKRPKSLLLATYPALRSIVENKLAAKWSPGNPPSKRRSSKVEFSRNEMRRFCSEAITIYR